MYPLLDIAIRRPRKPVWNIPDSIAASNDALPTSTMDTLSASTTGFDFNTMFLVFGLLLLIGCCFMVAARIRRQRLA